MGIYYLVISVHSVVVNNKKVLVFIAILSNSDFRLKVHKKDRAISDPASFA